MTILYHYCKTSSFLAIIKNKSICLSSLTLSNDTMEGKILLNVARKIIDKYNYDRNAKEAIINVFELFENTLDGLGFCMSEIGDLLSQWRGYADDGKGFSIGFSKDYLESLSSAHHKNGYIVKLHKVSYTEEEQEGIVAPLLDQIDKDIKSGVITIPIQNALYFSEENRDEYIKSNTLLFNKIFLKLSLALGKIFALKNGAFSEEKEWRLVSFMFDAVEDVCEFKDNNDRLIPYRVFEMIKLNSEPIKEIIIGPKNITPISIVEKMMATYGFMDIRVIRSTSTYR